MLKWKFRWTCGFSLPVLLSYLIYQTNLGTGSTPRLEKAANFYHCKMARQCVRLTHPTGNWKKKAGSFGPSWKNCYLIRFSQISPKCKDLMLKVIPNWPPELVATDSLLGPRAHALPSMHLWCEAPRNPSWRKAKVSSSSTTTPTTTTTTTSTSSTKTRKTRRKSSVSFHAQDLQSLPTHVRMYAQRLQDNKLAEKSHFASLCKYKCKKMQI